MINLDENPVVVEVQKARARAKMQMLEDIKLQFLAQNPPILGVPAQSPYVLQAQSPLDSPGIEDQSKYRHIDDSWEGT